jgi:SAM-dependent methyltransferase
LPVFLDLPDIDIKTPSVAVAGWIAARAGGQDISLAVNGAALDVRLCPRPDVKRAYPDFSFVTGLTVLFQLSDVPYAENLEITLRYGSEMASKTCSVAPHLRTDPQEDARIAAESRRFCESRLRCAVCGAARTALGFASRVITCGTQYRQNARSINMISDSLKIASNIAASDNVSSNPYTPDVVDLIDRTVAAGGWVLDCGAGSRDRRRPHVVNVEIVDYESTDMLAVGESLPFEDNSFDAVVSLAVLEHVRDPFACARELARVLKPGGTLIADVPFLQPVHGYPHHYYNMTEQGLRNLFADTLDIERCFTPPHGHPMFGIAWSLGQYRLGLPDALLDSFDAMTVKEIVALDLPVFLTQPHASQLSEAARQITSCLNTLIARKPHAS